MKYRRFGRTGLDLSVFSLGGMHFPRGWEDGFDLSRLTGDERALMRSIVERALEVGINHIETARGYKNSEALLAPILKDIPRERYHLQTKVTPERDPAAFEKKLEESMAALQADTLDLFGFHGINDRGNLEDVIRPGGCLEVIRRWQADGRIRSIGFSTHGSCATICEAVETGEFDYVNLHWYYINQSNWPAVEAATRHDMGVFIISPSDKGGMLYKPPQKLVDLCAPLHPMAFNDLFCLRRPEVHTLSHGAGHPDHFDEHLAALEHYDRIDEVIAPIEARIGAAMQDALGDDGWPGYSEGLPWYTEVPGEVNLAYILRLLSLARGLDMHDYAKYRYGMIEGGDGGNWMGGKPAVNFDEPAILELLREHPQRDRIPSLLREAHALFAGHQRQRLSDD